MYPTHQHRGRKRATTPAKKAGIAALALPQVLANELALLEAALTTFELRKAAVNPRGGLRGRFLTRLHRLRLVGKFSDPFTRGIVDELNRRCDQFIVAVLPPPTAGPCRHPPCQLGD